MLRFRLAITHGGPSVDVRLSRVNGHWLASADTPHGPSLGFSTDALAALYLALDPWQPAIDEALDTLPRGSFRS